MKRSRFLMTAVLLLAAGAPRAEMTARELCKKQFDSYKTKLTKNPTDAATWDQFRACMNELKRWNDGSLTASDIVEKNPDVWQAHLVLGITQLHTKDYGKAVAQFEKATALKNDQAQPYYYLGMAYLFQARSSDAADAAAKAVALEPQNASYHSQLAYALLLTDERDRCEAEAKKAIELDSNNVAAYKVLGNLYKKEGKPEESDKAFEEAMHANGRLAAASTGAKSVGVLPGMNPAAAPPPSASSEESSSSSSQEAWEKEKGPEVTIAYCRQQWRNMRDAILGGDTEGALKYFTDYAGTRDQYRKSFQKIGPERLRQMFASFGQLYDCQVILGATTCKAAITSNRDGVVQSTEETVRFERNPDKVWRIRSF